MRNVVEFGEAAAPAMRKMQPILSAAIYNLCKNVAFNIALLY